MPETSSHPKNLSLTFHEILNLDNLISLAVSIAERELSECDAREIKIRAKEGELTIRGNFTDDDADKWQFNFKVNPVHGGA